MSIETGVVIDVNYQPIYWHTPQNRSAVYLPDSQELWIFFKENTKNILGFAHSHPGSGIPEPSHEDITTFSALELSLGKKFKWWITSSSDIIELNWVGPNKYHYEKHICFDWYLPWLSTLKKLSYETD